MVDESFPRGVRSAQAGDVAGSPRRIWVSFETGLPASGATFVTTAADAALSTALLYGCGVTGLDADDCLKRMRDGLFSDRPMPAIRDVVFDIDVSTLDPMVAEHLGNPATLGVWFPAMNL
jgi:hypothetical protein